VDVKLVNETPGELHFELHSNQTSSLWENLKNVIESKGALVPAIQQQTSQGLSFSNPTANKSVPSSRTPKLCLVTGQKKNSACLHWEDRHYSNFRRREPPNATLGIQPHVGSRSFSP
jgi:hypothetical protein